ncbi:alpha/beta hydrolase [Agromyces soli]
MPAAPTLPDSGRDRGRLVGAAAPARLRLADLHPELRRAYSWTTRAFVQHDWQRRLVRTAMSAMPPARMPEGVTRELVEFATPGVEARVFTPAGGGDGGALLWIHGGGLVIGSAAQDDAVCAAFATALDVVVVSAEYRLAPEHPFPTPLDDCATVWDWLLRAAVKRGIDPARIAVGGQSAGGGLAAALVQRLHDEGGVQPVAQWLFCPMLDDRTAERRELDELGHYLWDNRANRSSWAAYLGGLPGTDARGATPPAYAVPSRRAGLEGLPPAWIGVGDVDLFHDEDREYADDLRAAGVDCELDVVEGAPHAFERFGARTAVGRDFTARALAWLAQRLRPAA